MNITDKAAALCERCLIYAGASTPQVAALAEDAVLLADFGTHDTCAIAYLGAVPADVPGFSVNIARDPNMVANRPADVLLEFFGHQEIAWPKWHRHIPKTERAKALLYDRDTDDMHVIAVQYVAVTNTRPRTDRFYMLYDGKWKILYDPGERFMLDGILRRDYKNQVDAESATAAVGVAFMSPALWWCRVSLDGSPHLKIPTSAAGAREIWRLRELAAGSKRRSALLHWVAEHWRTTPSNPDEEAQVRKHLRGQREFCHDGLSVEIIESREDYSAVLEAIRDRQLAKEQRLDRRRKR